MPVWCKLIRKWLRNTPTSGTRWVRIGRYAAGCVSALMACSPWSLTFWPWIWYASRIKGEEPPKFGRARPLASRIIRYVRDGQTKATLIASFPTSGGLITQNVTCMLLWEKTWHEVWVYFVDCQVCWRQLETVLVLLQHSVERRLVRRAIHHIIITVLVNTRRCLDQVAKWI